MAAGPYILLLWYTNQFTLIANVGKILFCPRKSYCHHSIQNDDIPIPNNTSLIWFIMQWWYNMYSMFVIMHNLLCSYLALGTLPEEQWHRPLATWCVQEHAQAFSNGSQWKSPEDCWWIHVGPYAQWVLPAACSLFYFPIFKGLHCLVMPAWFACDHFSVQILLRPEEAVPPWQPLAVWL